MDNSSDNPITDTNETQYFVAEKQTMEFKGVSQKAHTHMGKRAGKSEKNENIKKLGSKNIFSNNDSTSNLIGWLIIKFVFALAMSSVASPHRSYGGGGAMVIAIACFYLLFAVVFIWLALKGSSGRQLAIGIIVSLTTTVVELVMISGF